MIRDAEIRRIAGAAGVEPRIVELDYALGWALRGIAAHPYLSALLVFKGGTCLRKCYLPEYRFSEDLDITRDEAVVFEPVRRIVAHGFSDAGELSTVELDCYALEEVMTEKIRAVLGQRIFAISRDRADWDRNLVRLLPPGAETGFDEVWERVVKYVQRMAHAMHSGTEDPR
jgi:predicted nucleotidyltransferase component of viral defense system